MDFMHILSLKEATWNTIFSIFERRRGPQTSRGPGKIPPFPPLDGPAYSCGPTVVNLALPTLERCRHQPFQVIVCHLNQLVVWMHAVQYHHVFFWTYCSVQAR